MVFIFPKLVVEPCYRGQGSTYGGTVSVTKSGHICQHWNVDEPHTKYNEAANPDNFPDASLDEAMNYCRNPTTSDDTDLPWCYTTDPQVHWEECNVPKCIGEKDTP